MAVRPKKHLGQHFLRDLSAVDKTVSAVDPGLSDSFLEIGPGMGVLTQALLEKLPALTVVELDMESVVFLQDHFPEENLTIISGDVLKLDWSSLFGDRLSVLGNFPYNISSQILFKIWEQRQQVTQMVGMFQKEVAQRVCAKHGGKDYGILSVLIQAYYDTELCFELPPTAFDPPPKVDSAVIKLVRKTEEPAVDGAFLKTVVKMAFNQRRKKLSNALKPLLKEETVGFDKFLNLRAEQLSVSDFITLSLQLHGTKSDQ